MGYRVGVEIGASRASLCVVDAQGAILCRRVFGATGPHHAQRFTQTLCDHLEDLLLKRGLTPADVERIGIAVAGATLLPGGAVLSPEVFGAEAVPLRALVEGYVGVLPAVMGDAHAAAEAEAAQAPGEDLLCLTLGRSVGAALVRGGRVQTALATAIPADTQAACTAAVGTHAIARRAVERMPSAFPTGKPAAKDVFALAEQGDVQAQAVIRASVQALAEALAPALQTLDVRAVVLAGALCVYGTLLAGPLAERLAALWAQAGLGPAPAVRQAFFGGDAAMVGAALAP